MHAEAEHVGNLRLRVRLERLRHLHGTGVVDAVGHSKASAYGSYLIFGLDNRKAVLHGSIDGGETHLGIVPYCIPSLKTRAEVVVGRGAPEIRSQGLPLCQHVHTAGIVADNRAGTAVEKDIEACTGNGDETPVRLIDLRQGERDIVGLDVGETEFAGRPVTQRKLLLRHGEAGRQHAFGLLQYVTDIEQPLAGSIAGAQRQADSRPALRSYGQVRYAPAPDTLSVAKQLPLKCIRRQVTEEILIVHLDLPRRVDKRSPDILVIIPHLVHVRIGYAVRADETVVAEVLVTHVEAVKVSSVSVDHPAILPLPTDGLVDEVPDETALVLGILADKVPVLPETTFGVTHGVGIFALDKRPGLGGILAIADDTAVIHIHRAIDIALAVHGERTLILDRS